MIKKALDDKIVFSLWKYSHSQVLEYENSAHYHSTGKLILPLGGLIVCSN
jgi:hypothetical protein